MRLKGRISFALLPILLLALTPAGASAAPPTIANTHVSDVTAAAVTLNAEVNPEGKPTKYRFEYGVEDCATSTCTSVPLPEPSIGSGTSPVPVSFALEGLSPGALFHYRVVAKNGAGLADRSEGPDRLFATYAPPPSFGACPNDAFRTGEFSILGDPSAALPDCRAYEQASPIDKNGNDARGSAQRVRVAPDGSAATFGTTTSIPGGEGGQEAPLYLASLGEGAWSTQGLNPPASFGPKGFPLGWTPDFATAFSLADRGFGGQSDITILARDTATGTLRTIVPFATGMQNVSLAATSPDGSLALFESFGGIPTVPGTLPGKANLYLYQRDANTLSLAGVLNDGSVPAGGVQLGLGATPSGEPSYKQDNHAISTDGSYVFTDKATGRIYRRLNPTQPQSALDSEEECTEAAKACTVELSATEKENGQGNNGADAAGQRPAAFMTATPDGSKTFFTSPEKLTDDATTGPEPSHQAAIAKADLSDGANVDLEFLPAQAKGIAISGEYVYWANPNEESIGRSKLNGDEFDEEFVEGAGNAQYVAVDGEYLYWSNSAAEAEKKEGGVENEGNGTIGRAKLGPSEAQEVDPSFIEGAFHPQGVAIQGEYIYWANSGDVRGNNPSESATRAIGRAKLGPGEAEAVEQEFIPVGEGGNEYKPQGLAVNATHIYMTIDAFQEFSYVFRFDLDGEVASKKFLFDSKHEGKPGVRGIALDSGHVYWAREGEDTIGRANLELEGASAEREWIKEAGQPRGLALDASHIYWAANQSVKPNPGNDLYRYDAQAPVGHRLTDVAPDTADPDGVDVAGVLGASTDGSYLYYAAGGVPDGPIANSPNEEGEEAEPLDCDPGPDSRCNLYLLHGGTTTFVAQLSGAASEKLNDAENWLTAPGIGGVDKTSRVSADGRVLLFSSQRQLTPYDNRGLCVEAGETISSGPCKELYRFEADSGRTVCVSCNPTGAPPTGGLALQSIRLGQQTPGTPSSTLSRNLSADGSRVFFETKDRLLAADTNGLGGCARLNSNALSSELPCLDVYEWEAPGAGSCEAGGEGFLAQSGGCLYLLSTGDSPRASYFADADASGDHAFLFTRSQLVGQDEDQLLDLYSASVDGGLASQNPTPPTSCEGEPCKAGATPQPGGTSPATATFSGPPNPQAKQRHRKHRRKSKHKKRVHRSHRRANQTQGDRR